MYEEEYLMKAGRKLAALACAATMAFAAAVPTFAASTPADYGLSALGAYNESLDAASNTYEAIKNSVEAGQKAAERQKQITSAVFNTASDAYYKFVENPTTDLITRANQTTNRAINAAQSIGNQATFAALDAAQRPMAHLQNAVNTMTNGSAGLFGTFGAGSLY